jgi:hypothetical protein
MLLPFGKSPFDKEILSLDIAELAQASPKYLMCRPNAWGICQIAYAVNLCWLLRPSWKGKSQEHRAKSSPSDFFVHGVFPRLFFPSPSPSPAFAGEGIGNLKFN